MLGATPLSTLIDVFDNQRKGVEPIVLADSAINSFYQSLRARLLAGGLPTAADFALLENTAPTTGSGVADKLMMRDAMSRVNQVSSEAVRVDGLPGGSALPAQGVPIAEIEATRIDCKVAVLLAARSTRAGPTIDPALFDRRTPAAQPFGNMYEIYGEPLPSAVAFSQFRYGQPVPVLLKTGPVSRNRPFGCR